MQEYVFINSEYRNIKQKGDKLILNLFNEDILAKYIILGKYICIMTNDILNKSIIDKYQLYSARLTNSTETEIYKNISSLIKTLVKPITFAIKVVRKGEHKYNSTELAKKVAGAVFDKWPNIKVNLKEPKMEICVQIINNKSVVYII